MKVLVVVSPVFLLSLLGFGLAASTPDRLSGEESAATARSPGGSDRARTGDSSGIVRTSDTGSGRGDAPRAPLVVIDPGHGGTNTGAPGVGHGVYEKRFTLALSRRLARALAARGVRVALTRDSDEYLTLRQRVRMANASGADLLISVHANATAAHTQRGYETFVLSARGLDVDARALRRDDGLAGAMSDRDTALLVDDLERGAAHARAADVAAAVQSALRAVRGPDGDRGVKQDAMHVLFGARMPAVLVEVGFIDHPDEGPELADPEVAARLAAALADAIAASVR